MSDWMADDLEARTAAGLYRTRRKPQFPQGPYLVVAGREYVNFSSNDYLGFAGIPPLARAAASAARKYGTGAGASPLVSGWSPPLRALESALARWEETEAALVLSSGYAANLAAVSALAGPEDAIFSDELNHASLIDGCRLARAVVHVYRHLDCDHLAKLLRREGRRARRRLIVTDTLFSMDGDLAPLADLIELAERFDALLLIDEAHATGTIGAQGRGATDLLPASARRERLIKVGTLSKALGSQGGFLCGSATLIDYLVNHARPYIFSTALAPPAAAAALRAVNLVREQPQRRALLAERADQLRARLRAASLDIGRSCTHIVPVLLGDPEAALLASERLQSAGMFVPAIRPPSVPAGAARLRISLCVGHTAADIDALVNALSSPG